MSYVYVIIATIMFSFVGTLVKTASKMVPASAVSFSRFFFGILFLLLLSLILRRKTRLYFKSKWIFIAAAAKVLNYFCENTALRMSASYGNIIVYPVQAVALCVFSAIFFKEKIGPRKILATILCVAGVLMVSINGTRLSALTREAILPNVLLMIAALGAATFILCQKKLAKEVESIDMNTSVFLLGAIFASVPMGFDAGEFQSFSWLSLLALMGLGVITGGAFLLVAKSLEGISLIVSGMIQSGSVLFTLLWGALLFNEKLTVYTLAGVIIFLGGLVLINLAPKKGLLKY